ncbi:hypothetical protein L3Q82_004480 [Scortum barcoo]|uniref:Uncharacterized protein n=1 Tax=Scortum barcoo TaxID=214431 RepID=A0ACB8VKA4_9TELE|nr:hypothetical protein L3Q82_004480 [Scortum barcoo]
MESPASRSTIKYPSQGLQEGRVLCTAAVRPIGTNNSKRPIPNPKAQGSDPLVHRGELQHVAAELGSYEQAHTSSPPLTLGNSRVVEGPALSQGAGFQSPASYAWRDWVVEAPLPRLLPKPHCTGPSWTFLRVTPTIVVDGTGVFVAMMVEAETQSDIATIQWSNQSDSALHQCFSNTQRWFGLIQTNLLLTLWKSNHLTG